MDTQKLHIHYTKPERFVFLLFLLPSILFFLTLFLLVLISKGKPTKNFAKSQNLSVQEIPIDKTQKQSQNLINR